MCDCAITFPDLDIRPRVIGAGTDNESRCDDEASIGSPSSICTVKPGQVDVHNGSQVKTEPNDDDNKQQLVGKSQIQNQRALPKVVEGRPGHGLQDHIPALYQEETRSAKTHVAVRQPSQYAAEWVEDHRHVHASGRCDCGIDPKPITKPIVEDALTGDEEKVLSLHRQITGDGYSTEEWTPPSEEDIDRWRKETDVPELGTTPEWAVVKRRAPDATKYPVPLGNNMVLTEHFVVWDTKLLASRVESMQIASTMNGHGDGTNTRVPNGVMNAPHETIWVYQPRANEFSKDGRKKGGHRRHLGRQSRRDTVTGPQISGLIGFESPINSLSAWQHQNSQMSASFTAGQMQSSLPNTQYSFSQYQQDTLGHSMAVSQPAQYAQNTPYLPLPHEMTTSASALQYPQQMQQLQHGMNPGHSVLPEQQENILHKMESDLTVTPSPQQQPQATPTNLTLIEGGGSIRGWYELTPPNTHAGKGMNGKLEKSSSDLTTPTKPSQNAGKQTILPPAVVGGTRNSSIKRESGNGTSSETTSTVATPSKRQRKSAAQKLKKKQRKAERKKAGSDNAVNEKATEERPTIPLCGLPIGAGPESSKPHMPSFATCRLFYPVKRHCRGHSWPELHKKTQSLSSVRFAVHVRD